MQTKNPLWIIQAPHKAGIDFTCEKEGGEEMTDKPDWADEIAFELVDYFDVAKRPQVAAALRKAKADGKADGMRKAAEIMEDIIMQDDPEIGDILITSDEIHALADKIERGNT